MTANPSPVTADRATGSGPDSAKSPGPTCAWLSSTRACPTRRVPRAVRGRACRRALSVNCPSRWGTPSTSSTCFPGTWRCLSRAWNCQAAGRSRPTCRPAYEALPHTCRKPKRRAVVGEGAPCQYPGLRGQQGVPVRALGLDPRAGVLALRGHLVGWGLWGKDHGVSSRGCWLSWGLFLARRRVGRRGGPEERGLREGWRRRGQRRPAAAGGGLVTR